MNSPDQCSVFIQDDSPDGAGLWPAVDAAWLEGAQIWLRSPLLARLEASLGYARDGRRWLVIDPPDPSGSSQAWLRIRDVALSLLALLLLSPFLVVVAVLVKASSPGPAFYATTVIGRAGRPFVWRKFRSMRVLPESMDNQQRRMRFQAYVEGRSTSGPGSAPTKVIDHTRVTPVGRFIRRYSIDELPQLWNVLRGEMSLVGPRPCLPYEAEFFTGRRQRRFAVQPGLTGIWQVYGRGCASFNEAAAMDVFYTYRRSLGFDLTLMLKTVGVMVSGKGAL